MTEHTPTPWHLIQGNTKIVSKDGLFVADTMISHRALNTDGPEANAAYIVKACNTYPDLVKALVKIEYASRKDSLTDFERIESVRVIVLGALASIGSSQQAEGK
jgi:hypothetical protein